MRNFYLDEARVFRAFLLEGLTASKLGFVLQPTRPMQTNPIQRQTIGNSL